MSEESVFDRVKAVKDAALLPGAEGLMVRALKGTLPQYVSHKAQADIEGATRRALMSVVNRTMLHASGICLSRFSKSILSPVEKPQRAPKLSALRFVVTKALWERIQPRSEYRQNRRYAFRHLTSGSRGALMLAIRYYALILSSFLDTLLSKEDLWACVGGMSAFRMPSFVEAWAQDGGVQVLVPEKVDETNFKKMFDASLVIVFRGNALGFLFGKVCEGYRSDVSLGSIFGQTFKAGTLRRRMDPCIYFVMGSLSSVSRVDVGVSYTITENPLPPSPPQVSRVKRFCGGAR
uniref:Uncharacterized protein n=1 Tax=Chromera velia CCMP2878 TaxID=1169474 RepID=A0A0G4GPB8_9ALVE|eukprot:Cvel_22801.t1-p1 / transcript=Cvel_22801.t1 / gene=Cvel_22801 / organism=Chromera_velia_CCMP2878 / gene_product=hypothetical protein / transcript_product=hypothetical protein / location=Cvel_scaffold2281:28977-29954(+) / protein_length=291 / sequence_SO=supercontig / SO=protein_coding / is_pseudo=false